MELRNTTLTLGYAPPAQNMYQVLDMGDDDNDSTTNITVPTAIAAAATGTTTAASLLGQGTAAGSIHPGLLAAINQSIVPAFNQVVQNQSVLQNQIATMLLAYPSPVQAPPAFIVLPVQQVAFPMQQPFWPPMQQQQYQQTVWYGRGQQGMFQGGHGGQGGQGRSCRGSRSACQRRLAFATMICTQAGMGPYQGQQGMLALPNLFGGMGSLVLQTPAQNNNNAPSPIKHFANWNACFSCGFNVAEGHTSATCPFYWCKPNHQVRYTCENAALYAAYGPSTKGQHKTQFPPI
jgi:hypothetical protein